MFYATKLAAAQLIAQVASPYQTVERLPIEETTIVFSDPKFVLALVAGVVMAFGFQLLFTNLAIAVVAAPDSPSDGGDSESLGDTIRGIETKVGLGLLVSVCIALFCASFLAVKLSLVGSGLLGAITGIEIWAVFFMLLTWLGSTALGSLLGSVINTATSGIQGLLGTGTAVIGANAAKNQVVSTAEEITAAVRRELTAGFDPDSIRTTLQSSLSSLPLPKLDLDQVGHQFEKLLKDADLGAIADSDLLKNIDRDKILKLVSSRTDLSKQEVERIADQLESAWKQVIGQSGQVDPKALVEQLKSAAPDKLNQQLGQAVKSAATRLIPGGSLAAGAVELGATAVLNRVLQNTDFSDLDVEKIAAQLQTLPGKLLPSNGHSDQSSNGQAGQNHKPAKTPKPFSVIRADLENYLLFSPLWHLNRETVKHEFRDVIYDAAADPSIIRQELELINRDYLVEVLSLRNDFTPEGVQELAGYLEEIRAEVFSTVRSAETEGELQDLRSRVENYLRSTGKEELNPDAIGRDFQTLLEDPAAGIDALGDRLSQFDRSTLEQLLSQREDITAEESSQIVNQLESTRDRVLSQASELQDRVQGEAQELRRKVEDYLRNTNQAELNPEGIERDLRTLLDDPQAGLSALKARLSQFDRDTLVQLLSQRQDLSEEQVNQVLDQVESVRDSIVQAPQQLAGKAKEQYDQTTQAIADYLRRTNLEELDPEGIQHDLTTLLNDPKAGTAALQSRLSQVDRETLVKLFSQRDDLTEEQVNQAIDQVQSAIRNMIKAPRRLASRVQQQAVTFESNLESYLRNTKKDELNPEGIKRDLQQLLQDPKAGLSSLGDRISQFDRDTFVALLSQREDITEEEANRIADQVESNFKAIVGQIQQVQQAVQAQIEKGLGNVRGYLNSLERPELNYDSIKQDFGKLFDDPQVGIEALKNRLGEFDRDTLVAVLSSRSDISAADADRIIGQIESARDQALHRVEQIQQETQKRLAAVQHQAQKQLRGTRKIAAGAAWWVFSSALFSLVSAAIGGFLAAGRLIAL
ncbi:MAG: MFS transporter [Aphanocapsa sp. GSE-SYN-MK-11-07L]|nr:MFS transporter [Aphanocapsa sp. GSE-SYN-MK-11-07L]